MMSLLGKKLTVDVWFPFSKHEEEFTFEETTTYDEFINMICEEEIEAEEREEFDINLSIRRESQGYDIVVKQKQSKPASKYENNDETCWMDIQDGDMISVNRSIDSVSPRYHISLLHKNVLRTYNMSINSLFSLQLDKFLTSSYVCFRNIPNLLLSNPSVHARDNENGSEASLLDGNGYYRSVYVAVIEKLIISKNREAFATMCQLLSDCYDSHHRQTLAAGGELDEDEEEDVKELLKILLLASNSVVWRTMREFEFDVLCGESNHVDVTMILLLRLLTCQYITQTLQPNSIMKLDSSTPATGTITPIHSALLQGRRFKARDGVTTIGAYCDTYVRPMDAEPDHTMLRFGLPYLALQSSGSVCMVDLGSNSSVVNNLKTFKFDALLISPRIGPKGGSLCICREVSLLCYEKAPENTNPDLILPTLHFSLMYTPDYLRKIVQYSSPSSTAAAAPAPAPVSPTPSASAVENEKEGPPASPTNGPAIGTPPATVVEPEALARRLNSALTMTMSTGNMTGAAAGTGKVKVTKAQFELFNTLVEIPNFSRKDAKALALRFSDVGEALLFYNKHGNTVPPEVDAAAAPPVLVVPPVPVQWPVPSVGTSSPMKQSLISSVDQGSTWRESPGESTMIDLAPQSPDSSTVATLNNTSVVSSTASVLDTGVAVPSPAKMTTATSAAGAGGWAKVKAATHIVGKLGSPSAKRSPVATTPVTAQSPRSKSPILVTQVPPSCAPLLQLGFSEYDVLEAVNVGQCTEYADALAYLRRLSSHKSRTLDETLVAQQLAAAEKRLPRKASGFGTGTSGIAPIINSRGGLVSPPQVVGGVAKALGGGGGAGIATGSPGGLRRVAKRVVHANQLTNPLSRSAGSPSSPMMDPSVLQMQQQMMQQQMLQQQMMIQQQMLQQQNQLQAGSGGALNPGQRGAPIMRRQQPHQQYMGGYGQSQQQYQQQYHQQPTYQQQVQYQQPQYQQPQYQQPQLMRRQIGQQQMYQDSTVSDIDSVSSYEGPPQQQQGRVRVQQQPLYYQQQGSPRTVVLSEAQTTIYNKVRKTWPALTKQNCMDICTRFNTVAEYDAYVAKAMSSPLPDDEGSVGSGSRGSLNNVPLTTDQRIIYNRIRQNNPALSATDIRELAASFASVDEYDEFYAGNVPK